MTLPSRMSGGMELHRIFIGVDPGASGGLAFLDAAGHVLCTIDTPDNAVDLALNVSHALTESKRFRAVERTCYIEDVNSMPGWGHVGPFTFGRYYGRVEGVLAAEGLIANYVVPRVWQRSLNIIFPKKTPSTDKKRELMNRARLIWPDATVTHANADALLIAEYGRRVSLNLQIEGSVRGHHGEEVEDRREDPREAEGQGTERQAAARHGEHAPREARAARRAGR